MYSIFVRLILIAALLDLGKSITESERRSSITSLSTVEQLQRRVLKIDWKPISIFPEEAGRFRKASASKLQH